MKLENISLFLGEKMIFRDFCLDLPAQGCFVFFGPSGCGKTTLLHLLSGLIEDYQGKIISSGSDKISMVFQENRLLPWLTVGNNILAVMEKKDHSLVRQYLDIFGLQEEGSHYPQELSGGMKRRVAIARALAYDGDILLLDEPFKGLDGAIKNQVMQEIEKLKAKKLILLVTHDKEEAAFMADAVYLVKGLPLEIMSVVKRKDGSCHI